jgi:hypothetical protein
MASGHRDEAEGQRMMGGFGHVLMRQTTAMNPAQAYPLIALLEVSFRTFPEGGGNVPETSTEIHPEMPGNIGENARKHFRKQDRKRRKRSLREWLGVSASPHPAPSASLRALTGRFAAVAYAVVESQRRGDGFGPRNLSLAG